MKNFPTTENKLNYSIKQYNYSTSVSSLALCQKFPNVSCSGSVVKGSDQTQSGSCRPSEDAAEVGQKIRTREMRTGPTWTKRTPRWCRHYSQKDMFVHAGTKTLMFGDMLGFAVWIKKKCKNQPLEKQTTLPLRNHSCFIYHTLFYRTYVKNIYKYYENSVYIPHLAKKQNITQKK